MEEDLVVIGSNTMDFVITDLVVLNKKDKVPPDYVVVSASLKKRKGIRKLYFRLNLKLSRPLRTSYL